jgi:hypothetical protein
VSETLTSKSPAEMTPVEIDTELAHIYEQAMAIEVRIVSDVRFIERQTKRADKAPLSSWDQKNLDQAKVRLAELQDQRLGLIAAQAPFEMEYLNRGRWARYYRVTNSNGHIHSSMHCTTCFPTTQYAWVYDLADRPEAEMVEEFGEKACTVCFPDAPTLPSFNGPGRRNQEAKDARAAERQAKADAKTAKAITAPDGSPLKTDHLGRTEVIATEVTARRELSRAYVDSIEADETRRQAEAKGEAEDASWAETRRQVYIANMALLMEAIAAKHGQTVEEVQAEVQPALDRALKAYRKEQARWQAHFAARGLA